MKRTQFAEVLTSESAAKYVAEGRKAIDNLRVIESFGVLVSFSALVVGISELIAHHPEVAWGVIPIGLIFGAVTWDAERIARLSDAHLNDVAAEFGCDSMK
jgi:hypothetical protein